MFSKAILLFIIIVPLSSAIDTPLVRILPKDRFSASSSYNESVTAPNVRFPSEQIDLSASKEPWCPATRTDYDYFKEYVTVDLGCQQTVRKVEGKDSHVLQYFGEYSNDEKKWKTLTSKDKRYYDKTLKVFKANYQAEIKPPVKARYFRFRIRFYDYSRERQPCLKVEMYGSSPCEPEKPVEPEVPVQPGNPVEPIGCFQKRRLPIVYHTVTARVDKKCPGILAVYEECKQKAAENSKPLEIFGIWNNRKCVTSKTGKFDEYFNKAPDSRNCKTCQGKGIGSKKTAVFVYKK